MGKDHVDEATSGRGGAVEGATGWRRLVLTGGLTVREVEDRRSEFLAFLAGADRIEVESRGLSMVDVAGLQALIALRLSAEKAGKKVRLASPPEGALLQALIAAGFWVAGTGGEAVVAHDRFWRGEG